MRTPQYLREEEIKYANAWKKPLLDRLEDIMSSNGLTSGGMTICFQIFAPAMLKEEEIKYLSNNLLLFGWDSKFYMEGEGSRSSSIYLKVWPSSLEFKGCTSNV